MKLLITMLLPALFFFSCGNLKIDNYKNENSPESTALLTASYNFQRNAVSKHNLKPPLTIIWDETFSGLAAGSFSVVGNWLFYASENGYVGVVDLQSGEEVSEKKLGKSCSVPPTISGRYLYQTFESGSEGLIVYDLEKNEELWTVEGNNSRASPIVAGNKVFLLTLDGHLYCYHHITGDAIWKSKKLVKSARSSPALSGDLIIVAGNDGEICAVEFTSGIVVWKTELNTPVFSDPLVAENSVFISAYDGSVFRLKTEDGTVQKIFKTDALLYFQPTVFQNLMYIAQSDGKLICFDLKTGAIIWKFAGTGPAAAAPLVMKNIVSFGTLGKHLYLLNRYSGDLLQDIKLNGRVRSVPVIQNGKMVIACEDKKIVALAAQ